MSKEKKYVKLGPLAGSFSDPYSQLVVRRNEVVELDTVQKRRSKKVLNAIRGGHLERADEKEYQESIDTGKVSPTEDEDLTLKEQLGLKKKAELVELYKSTYDVTEEEVEDFEKLTKTDMVDELVELAEEE